jgi:serine/threonine-protein kinase
MELRANDVLGDRFRLERLLGEGGMGTVWSAFELKTNQRVALKFLRGNASPEAMKRFFREARAAMAVKHPSVVRVHEVCVGPDGSPLMVMEFLQGESLGDRLQRGKLLLSEAAPILLRVVSAIGTAHSMGIVHRDLKPDNVYVVAGERHEKVRVLDFGIAKLTAQSGEAMATAGLTSTGAVLGTPYYMSPEQVFADKTIDHRCDIWSIGVMTYECLTGKKPITGDSIGALLRAITDARHVPLQAVEPELPPDVCDLVERMLSVERDARPRDLREVFAILARYSPRDSDVLAFGEATADGTLGFDDTAPSERLKLSTIADAIAVSSKASTADGVAHSQHVVPTRPSRKPILITAMIAALLGGAGIAVVAYRNNATTANGATSAASQVVAASGVLTETVPSAPATASVTSTPSAAPSASASAVASTSKVPQRPVGDPRRRPGDATPQLPPITTTSASTAPAKTGAPAGPVFQSNNPYGN